jgi:hypothetical protein
MIDITRESVAAIRKSFTTEDAEEHGGREEDRS